MVIVAITVGFCFLILSLWLVRAVFNSLGNFIEVFSGLVVLFFPTAWCPQVKVAADLPFLLPRH